MIIQVFSDGSRCLVDADDFKKFKVVVKSGAVSKAVLERSLGALGRVSDDCGHVWIKPEEFVQLEGATRGADWVQKFEAMVETARKYGFVEEATGAVRAHVEQVPE